MGPRKPAGFPLSEFWSSLPCLMTVVALVAVSAHSVRRRLGTPTALGIPCVREES